MAAPTMTRGLTPADLDQIRGALGGGRRPKVTFTESAGQIAGQTGQVVALADPTHSDEWITVRFGKDELPFSPADLTVPGRAVKGRAAATGRAASSAAAKQHTEEEAGVTRSRGTRAVAAKAAPAKKAKPPAAEPAFVLDQPVRPAPTSTTAPKPAEAAAQPTAEAATGPAADAEVKPKAEPRKAAKVKPPASLVVTLSYTDREWTLAATQGTKALAKPYVITPTEALRIVALIDVPTVHEAVENIITAERAEAQGKAERLRAELAEIEARLAELAQHA